jgi:NTE family protein
MRTPYVPPRRLILSGGGLRVISFIGVLQVLEEQSMLSKIREFCGVSAGALVGTMLALGYSLQKIERFFLEYDFSEVRTLEPENMFLVFEEFGIDSGERLEGLIKKFLFHKGFGPNTTFRELAESGRCRSLRVWAADIQMAAPIEFSAKSTPDMEVVFALRASTAIPGYFIPPRHPETDRILADGGVFDNYPISYVSDQEANESIGITFTFGKMPQSCEDFGKFLGLVIAGYYMPSYQKLIEKHKNRTIELPCYEFSALHFEATLEEKKELIAVGRAAAMKFFGTRTYSGRRHSVS